MSKFGLDTGSDGNLMPIKVYRMLFSQTRINELNKPTNKNSDVHLQ